MKTCSKCKIEKEDKKFGKDKSRSDGLDHRCFNCKKLNNEENRTKQKIKLSPEEYRKARRREELKYYYGMSEEQYSTLEKEQNYGCAICDSKPKKYLAVDHNHKTNKIRGLLCSTCNNGLGCFKDDPIKLQKALNYLINPKEIEGVYMNKIYKKWRNHKVKWPDDHYITSTEIKNGGLL